ncbi:elongation factor G [Chlamydiota bacterium]
MKGFEVKNTRTYAVVGHSNVGKTVLVDAMLFNAGANDRLGKVDTGTSIVDTDSEEKKRKITITSKAFNCTWNNHNHFILNTPGYLDFYGEMASSVWISDSVIMVVDAVSGVEVGTVKVWDLVERAKKPGLFFINKMDKENAQFYEAVSSIQDYFGKKCIPLQLPIGSQSSFKGIVDILSENDLARMDEEAKKYYESNKETLIEAIAETDDTLLEKYLEGEQLTKDELNNGLLQGIITGKIYPILCGSAEKNSGIKELLDKINKILPSPAEIKHIPLKEGTLNATNDDPFSALVFKTITDPYVGQLTFFRIYSGQLQSDSEVMNVTTATKEKLAQLYVQRGKEQINAQVAGPGDIIAVAKLKKTHLGNTFSIGSSKVRFDFVELPKPVLSFAIKPKSKGDEEKMSTGLARIAAEDATLTISRNAETKELILSGMGDVHLEIALSKLRDKFGIEVETAIPKVPYKETIKASAEGHEKHKKQSGGKGQYGECFIRIHPLERGTGFEFVDQIVGGVIPKGFIPAIEKGIVGKMEDGILAGFQVIDVKVELYFGSYHTVDSSEMAFRIAGSKSFQDAFSKAKPILLEPIMDAAIVIPDEFTGDISGDINHKRGRIMGIEPKGKMQVVKAQLPLSEMFKYANEMRSLTQGRGTFSMEFSHYEEVPSNITEKVIAEAKKEEE